jgi:flagella basal body P-ring formation protein FlgA
MHKFFAVFCFLIGCYGETHGSDVPVYRHGITEITSALNPLITQQIPQFSDFEIVLDNVATAIQGQGNLEIIDLRMSPDQRRFNGLIALVLNGQRTVQARISGRIQVMMDVPVLNKSFNVDEIITKSDVTWIKQPSDKVHPQTIMDATYIIGKAPFMKSLQPGKPLIQNDVRAPILVKRGSLAYITYRSGAMVLTTQAEAKNDGIKGELVQFQPENGKRTIQAVVTGLNEAEITPFNRNSGTS